MDVIGDILKRLPKPGTAEASRQLSTISPAALAATLEILLTTYGRPSGWEMAVPMYEAALEDLTADELKQAMRRLATTHDRFMPTPKQIRAAAGRGEHDHCQTCRVELTGPDSRRLGQCRSCRGAGRTGADDRRCCRADGGALGLGDVSSVGRVMPEPH